MSLIFSPNLELSCLNLLSNYGLKLSFFYFSRYYSVYWMRLMIFSSTSFIWSRKILNLPAKSFCREFWIFLIPAISFLSTLHCFAFYCFTSFLIFTSPSIKLLSLLTLLWTSFTIVSFGSDFKRIRGDEISLEEQGGDTICLLYIFLWDRTRCNIPSGDLFLTKY